MCGIYLSEAPLDELLKNYIAKRGKSFQKESKNGRFNLFSSVLAIRSFVPQPVVESGYCLMYNGEIYNREESDTLFISKAMKESLCCRLKLSSSLGERFEALEVFYSRLKLDENKALIESELAVIVTDGEFVYFFKDDIGKRSLGYKLNPFVLSSVKYELEIDPMKLYIYDSNEKRLHWKFKEKTGLVKRYLSSMGLIKRYLFSKKYLDQYSFFTGYESIGDKESNCDSNSKDDNNSKDSYVSKIDTLFRTSFALRKSIGNPIIFFSGGIDSLLVAIYIHMTTAEEQEIYLINTGTEGSFDRIEGEKSYKDLQDKFTSRKFIFIKNNLDPDRIREHRQTVKDLIYPKLWNMDLNISTVLYFSAMCASEYGNVVYTGAGADEIFGGYRKYTSEYARQREKAAPSKVEDNNLTNGYDNLTNRYGNDEDCKSHILFDLFTISPHNIGRDDRSISYWNIEARFPFLDYKIIEWALSLPLDLLIKEEENKAILRDLLRFHGFTRAALVPKKAMQYGSGMSKFEGGL